MGATMILLILLAAGKFVAIVALCIVAFLLLVPWVLAALTVLRDHYVRQFRRWRRKPRDDDDDDDDDNAATVPFGLTLEEALSVLRLYNGRVWHSRYRPVLHEFTYPVFLFEVNLSALHQLMIGSRSKPTEDSSVYDQTLFDAMWPLSIIVQFRSEDHLKNGEGMMLQKGDGGLSVGTDSAPASVSPPLLRRVQTMLQQAQQRKMKELRDHSLSSNVGGSDEIDDDHDWNLLGAKDGPTRRHYRVGLVTNLSYYGYCFNPVSYYLVFQTTKEEDKEDYRQVAPADATHSVTTTDHVPRDEIRAVIGEVSNTPWGEMHCYVLLPREGGDDQQQNQGDEDKSDIRNGKQIEGASSYVRFVFPKMFHVSPFMEMHYDYDWSFRYYHHEQSTRNPRGTTMDIHNSLVVIKDDDASDDAHRGDASAPPPSPQRRKPRPRQFHARLLVHSPSSPTSIWSIAYQLSKYPVYGLIVQLWIHYQALLLFMKRVEFQPHPQGSETWASQAIGTLMAPFFALLALWEEKKEGFASGHPDISHNISKKQS